MLLRTLGRRSLQCTRHGLRPVDFRGDLKGRLAANQELITDSGVYITALLTAGAEPEPGDLRLEPGGVRVPCHSANSRPILG